MARNPLPSHSVAPNLSIRKVLESQPFLITANVLSGILAIAIIGLVADNLHYVHTAGAKNGSSMIGYNSTDDGVEEYNTAIVGHLPADLRIGSYWLILAAGIGGFIDAVLLGGMLCWRRLKSASLQVEHGETYDRNLKPQTPLAIFIATVAFCRSLAATIYGFQEWAASGTFSPAIYLHLKSNTKYDREFFTPDAWNCQYEDYVLQTNESNRIQNLCTEGTAARTMTLALAVMSAFVLYGVCYRAFLRRRGAQRSAPHGGFVHSAAMGDSISDAGTMVGTAESKEQVMFEK